MSKYREQQLIVSAPPPTLILKSGEQTVLGIPLRKTEFKRGSFGWKCQGNKAKLQLGDRDVTIRIYASVVVEGSAEAAAVRRNVDPLF
jgi:hypothetical protein